MCMRVELHHTKKGISSCPAFSMKVRLAARNSSSTVSIRFIVKGPVFSIFCVPSALAQRMKDASWAKLLLELGILWIVLIFGFLLGVQVIGFAEELVEPVGVGRNSSRSPGWFLPNRPVTYPSGFNTSAMVGSSGCIPRVAPESPTFVRPVRIAKKELNPRCADFVQEDKLAVDGAKSEPTLRPLKGEVPRRVILLKYATCLRAAEVVAAARCWAARCSSSACRWSGCRSALGRACC